MQWFAPLTAGAVVGLLLRRFSPKTVKAKVIPGAAFVGLLFLAVTPPDFFSYTAVMVTRFVYGVVATTFSLRPGR